jgi:hypothetical protein
VPISIAIASVRQGEYDTSRSTHGSGHRKARIYTGA